MTQSDENFTCFCVIVLMCKGSQRRIYADLLRFHSTVKEPIILMKSIIPFLIHSFCVLILVYGQEDSSNISK